MSTRPDLEAYVLGELAEAAQRDVERYLASNPEAAAEVERLELVTAALRRLPEEEPPRRIAFVSDKVFEPKWYHRLWNSAPRLAFGSATMLAGAIVAHGYLTMPPRPLVTAAIDSQEISRRVDVELNRRLDASLTRAVSAMRVEADAKSKQMVATALTEAEKRFALERQADRVAVDASFDVIRKQMNLLAKYNLASNQAPGAGR